MSDVRVMEFRYGKARQFGGEVLAMRHSMARVVFRVISPEESLCQEALTKEHSEAFIERNENLKFIIVPNGSMLPVPAKHYRP